MKSMDRTDSTHHQCNWYQAGKDHVWRPYTQEALEPNALPVVRTEGSKIILADGRELVDGTSSWWTAAHGYQHPYLTQAATTQLETMTHVMFGGLAHEPAYRLAERLCHMAPGNARPDHGLTRCFFTDSGSVAVEVAMKMALQYWQNIGKPRKDRFICLHHGYHGDTLGAMSVSDPEKSMHKAFKNNVIMHYVLDLPRGEYDFAEFEDTICAIKTSCAGLIMEPLVQAAGGMRFHSPDILAEIYRICHQHDLLFIADEIAVGFGRTGSLFACEEAGIVPDIMCLGKALTGGMMTLAATLAKEQIYQAFVDSDPSKALMHGPTYMANPLACTIANASLDLFEQENRLAQVAAIEQHFYRALMPLGELSGVMDVRVMGAIGVVQLAHEYMDIFALRQSFIEHGVWVRPIEDVIYLMPPFTISESELAKLTDAVTQVVTEWSQNVRAQVNHLFEK